MSGRLVGVGVGPGRPRAPHAQGPAGAARGRRRLRARGRRRRARPRRGRRARPPRRRPPRAPRFALGDDRPSASAPGTRAGARVAAALRRGGTAAFATIGDPNLYSHLHLPRPHRPGARAGRGGRDRARHHRHAGPGRALRAPCSPRAPSAWPSSRSPRASSALREALASSTRWSATRAAASLPARARRRSGGAGAWTARCTARTSASPTRRSRPAEEMEGRTGPYLSTRHPTRPRERPGRPAVSGPRVIFVGAGPGARRPAHLPRRPRPSPRPTWWCGRAASSWRRPCTRTRGPAPR